MAFGISQGLGGGGGPVAQATPTVNVGGGGIASSYGQINAPATIPQGTMNVSPTVVTSNAATQNLGNIQTQTQGISQGITNQAANIAAQKAADDLAKQQQAQQDAQNKAAADKAAADKADKAAKLAAINNEQPPATPTKVSTNPNATVTNNTPYSGDSNNNPTGWQKVTLNDGTTQVVTVGTDASGNPVYTPVSQQDLTLQQNKDALAQQSQDLIDKGNAVSKLISDIANGVIPLNPAEQAQVTGLQQSFQQLIQQQTLANQNASGIANVRGYQTGSAEYDPTFQVNTIGSIVTAGINKVSDLNIKMASAVADLTNSFRTNDINAIKDSWDVYQTAAKDREATLQKTIDDTQTQITKAQDQIQKNKDDVASIADEAAKNGASPEVLKKINATTNKTDAITAAGDALNNVTTGIVGEYNFYKKDALAHGQTPMDFNAYQTYDANRKAASTVAAQKAQDAADIADAIISGIQPADLSKLYGQGAAVRAILARKGYNLTTAAADWTAMQTFLKNQNSSQQLRMRQAEDSVKQGLTNLDTLNNAFDRYGLTAFNKAKLAANAQGVGTPLSTPLNIVTQNSDGKLVTTTINNTAELASAYLTQINLITDELGQTFMGGNSPTDRAFALAQASLKGDWSADMLRSQIATLRQNLQYRENSWSNVEAMGLGGGSNMYSSGTAAVHDENADNLKVVNGLNSIKTTNPKLYESASNMYTSNNPATGQPYTASDILQAFPELAQ